MCINTRLPKNWNPTHVRLPRQRKREGYLVKRIKISLKSEKWPPPTPSSLFFMEMTHLRHFLSFFKPFKTLNSLSLPVHFPFVSTTSWIWKSYPCKKNYKVKFLYISFFSNILLIFHFSLCSSLGISYEVQ